MQNEFIKIIGHRPVYRVQPHPVQVSSAFRVEPEQYRPQHDDVNTQSKVDYVDRVGLYASEK